MKVKAEGATTRALRNLARESNGLWGGHIKAEQGWKRNTSAEVASTIIPYKSMTYGRFF